MDTSEELREILLDLEESRKKEVHERRMAEALLEGLRVLATNRDPQTLFGKLFDTMRKPLEFEDAFVLLESDEDNFAPLTTSNPVFSGTVWRPGSMLGRVLRGQPVAVFDTHLVEEWTGQPEPVKRIARSALHFSIHTAEKRAVMVCTHSGRAHFSQDHVALARRFSVLATEALRKLESETMLADLKRKLDDEIRIAELNRRLAESEQKLARSRKMEAVGLLAGGVAHDLNNILTGIVSYPDLLLMDNTLRPELRGAIETIRDAGLRAAAVVEDLLTVARGAATTKEPLNINRIIDKYLASPEHHRLTQLYGMVRVEKNITDDLFAVSGSPVHINKALMNLIYNAVEAVHRIPEGRVSVETQNMYIDRPFKGYSDVRAGEYVVLSVKDNGGGISKDDLERIFEPFYTKRIMGRVGTGLGLTIVWNVMEDHEGYVDVRTGEEGTEFYLFFPATRDVVSDTEGIVTPGDFQGNGESVLVVDDLEDQRNIACAILTKLGYSARSAISGEMALEYLRDHAVDMILLDMIMDPGIGGLETYKKIVEIYPGQKAVIASGYSINEDVVAAQRLGAGPFIKKPYTLAKLGQALKDGLNR